MRVLLLWNGVGSGGDFDELEAIGSFQSGRNRSPRRVGGSFKGEIVSK